MIIQLGNVSLLTWFRDQKESCGIVHQCNCFHTMGAGIARRIADAYPEAYEADKQTDYGKVSKLGTFSFALAKNTLNKRIYNLYGQFDYGRDGRKTSYDAVFEGLTQINVDCHANELTRLGIPYNMGCRLSGGDWNIVKAIINSVFSVSTIDLYICRYEP